MQVYARQEERMKRFALALALAAVMAIPGSAMAAHHVFIPAGACADDAAGTGSDSPSNRPRMRENINEKNPAQDLPLPPAGTPGANKGQGGDHCANG
jgi:hypothetical protein